MSKVNPYTYYSDFDQAWLGELPSHWQVMRTKLLFDLVTEFAPVGNSEELLSVYTAIGVKPRKELEARGNKASSTDNYWRVQQGDIIVNKLLAWMGAIGISEYNGVTSPAYDILRPKETVNPYYYNFLFRNPIASREFKRHSRGIMDMRLRLYFTRFGDIKLPLPPMEEQVKIVEYLQYKLKKIDRFIRKKKQLIKLLNEQKAVIINSAVTKGLNSKAKMKHSGIEWLGDIPKHWGVKRLKYLLKTGQDGIKIGPFGSAIKSEIIRGKNKFALNEPKFKVYGQEHPIASDFSIGNKYIGQEDFNRLENYEIISGDIVISMMGTIGRSKVVPVNIEKGIMDSHLIRIGVNNEIYSDYISALINDSSSIMTNMLYESKGAIMNGLNSKIIKALFIPLPPLNEQKEIQLFIKDETEKINITISTIEKEIALTQEYRTALIAEAVTGKIDVCDFEIPETLEEESYEELEEELSIAAEELDCDLE